MSTQSKELQADSSTSVSASSIEKQTPPELKIQKRLLTPLLSKKLPPLPQDDSERKLYPERHTNPIYRLFYWWMTPLMAIGYKRTIQPNDLYLLDDDSKIEAMYYKFVGYFDVHVAKLRKQHEESGSTEEFKIPLKVMLLSLYKTFWFEYTVGCVEKVLSDLASTFSPLLQKKLITFVEHKAYGLEPKIGKGVGYSIGCCLFVLFTGIAINHFFNHSMVVGAKCKAVLTKLMLEKSFRLDPKGHHRFPTGKINSIMSTDLNRIDLAIGFLPFLFLFPIPIIICIVLLLVNIGVSALVGLGVFALCTGLVGSTVKPLMRLRGTANVFTDTRINLIKELLKNFKMIKFYSWEDFYRDKISFNRQREMEIIFKMQSIRTVITSLAISLSTLSSMVSFCVLWAINSSRSIGDIFASLTLFQVLSQQFMLVPMAMAMATDMAIGLRRVCEFMSQDEVEAEGEKTDELDDPSLALKVENAEFHWKRFDLDEEENNDDDKGTLRPKESINDDIESEYEQKSFPGLIDLNFEIKKGEFVVVTGSIGSGKSSLLNALSGFMHKEAGHVLVSGSLLLCGYPWVQNTTVRENILFGLPYDSQKYHTVIESCSLPNDFQQLPGGDMTEVGERGITLSGGQKARINLARAVYAGKDIILMDDVLSAVDAKVGKHIMDTCIMGYLSDKTRILATHQLSLIGSADRIIFLNGDGSIDIGTFSELSSGNQSFVKLMEFSNELTKEMEEQDIEEEQDFIQHQAIQRQLTKIKSEKPQEKVSIVQDEERAVNAIKLDVYKSYVKLGSGNLGYFFIPILLLVCILGTFCQLFTNNWLSFWAEDKFPNRSDHFYIGIYIMFAFLMVAFLSIEFYLIVYLSNRSSKKLNILAAARLLHAPMSYIDTTPMGRILNRFTKDTDVLDNEISEQIRLFIFPFCTLTGVMILCIIYLPWFAIAVPIIVVIYICVANFYQASSREIKRLEAIQRSAVYAHFNETLGGMDTIKAYKSVDRFLNSSDILINNMNEAYYVTIANQRWLAVNLDMIATSVVLIIALLCCFRVFSISAGATGLLLTYVLTIAGLLSLLLRAMTQVENEMNSVERLKYYATDLPQEAAYRIPERDPAPSWPSQGAIKFVDVSLRYRPELPYVLKNLSIDVKPNERIGICGRTGAGKSTLMTCLYRISEPEGLIEIDGIDISQLGLNKLRSKLSIIPQDPVLFVGTIRNNLDPFGERSDEELWDATRRANLVDESVLDKVKAQTKRDDSMHKFHLEQMVEDDGTNFSLGERQLLALARALVRKSKVLILDEATSSVDYETDSKIQQTIATEFADCTILCIAHRLKTIVNYDRILVLEKGEINEFDTPYKLYSKVDGAFRGMCDQSGIEASDFEKS